MKSKFLNLDVKDAINGFIVAFLTASLSGLVTILDTNTLPTGPQIKQAAIIGLTAGLSYLIKNFLTNSKGEIAKAE